MSQDFDDEKREYQSPSLVEYGDIESLTQSGAFIGGDGEVKGTNPG